MLKLALSLVLCLACLWLEGEAAPQGGNDNGPAGPVSCPESQVECNREECQQYCESVGYRVGRCTRKDITCDPSDFQVMKCKCLYKLSAKYEDSSETANAGEGSSSNATNSDNSDSYPAVTKKSRPGKPDASSKAPALGDATAAPTDAAANSGNPAGGQYVGARTTTAKTQQRPTTASETL
ncbi:hypothetical protein BsWGS_21868 [Bradybaena similaris]